ncbi:MAG: ATP-binding protein [Alistipes sp.]
MSCQKDENRPDKVPDNVTAQQKRYNFYIRYNSSSMIAKGEFEHELIELTNQIPFDDRANMQATLKDVSKTLVRDFLVKTDSRLAEQIEEAKFSDVLQQMDVVAGPEEVLLPKNIALMMFSDNLARFFPYTQVDIVVYPKGKLQDPSNFIEVPPIKGPVDAMINEVMTYLRTNVIKERVAKPADKAESVRFFNYPYQALEEAVVNALYHRDYQTREPVEVTIEPDCICIISYGGPDRSIRLDELNRGVAHARRYRNRKLGDFLKELDLTEGKATGIPTIIKEMKANGSPEAVFDSDEARTYFAVTFLVHEAFGDPQSDPQSGTMVTARQYEILQLIQHNPLITRIEISHHLDVSEPTVKRDIQQLRSLDILAYEGFAKSGKWVIDTTIKVVVN